MMWFVWRQKFMVSCKSQASARLFEKLGGFGPSDPLLKVPRDTRCPQPLSPPAPPSQQKCAYLVVGSALEKKDVDHGQLVDESVALKLLPHAGADG
jgi:hypothetical protein